MTDATEEARAALVEAVRKVLPVGNHDSPGNRVIAFYIRMDELRALHELVALSARVPPIASPELVEKVALPDRETIARLTAYIAAYEDALTWAGPIIYPPAPSTKDLRAILALTTGGG